MHITFYFIRHGFSCTNAIYEYAPWYYQHKRYFYLDPVLTKYGREQSLLAANIVNDVDLVLSSGLMRSIETGLYMFPNHTVHVIPYIAENVPGWGNYSNSIDEQKKYLGPLEPRVNYDAIVENPSTANISDFSQFLKWIKTLLKTSDIIPKDAKHLKIAVMTHSNFMMSSLKLAVRPKNNAIVEQCYEFNDDDVLDSSGTLPVFIFDGFDAPPVDKYKENDGHCGCQYEYVI